MARDAGDDAVRRRVDALGGAVAGEAGEPGWAIRRAPSEPPGCLSGLPESNPVGIHQDLQVADQRGVAQWLAE